MTDPRSTFTQRFDRYFCSGLAIQSQWLWVGIEVVICLVVQGFERIATELVTWQSLGPLHQLAFNQLSQVHS